MLRKRKRKSSGEDGAAARATRQRRVLDDGEAQNSVLERTIRTPKAPKTPKTPATGRRSTRQKNPAAGQGLTMSTRSRKAIVLKSSSDSDVEKEIEQPRLRSKRAVGKRDMVDSISSAETHTRTSRTRKDANDTTQQSTEHRSDVENSSKSLLSKHKRPTRKKRVLISVDNTIVESSRTEKTPVKCTTRSQATKSVAARTNPVTDSTESPETMTKNPPLGLKHSGISTIGKLVKTPRKISSKKSSSSLITISTDTVTPESSPIPVTLTPHRSSQTPKKLPMNISSPKIHSQSPLRLSKTPRKLTVTVESPASSDKSSVAIMSTQSLNELQVLARENQYNPLVILNDIKNDCRSPTEKDSGSSPTFVATAALQLRRSRETRLNNSSNSSIATLVPSSPWSVDEISANISSPNVKLPKRLGIPGSKIQKSPIKTPGLVRKLEALETPPINRVSTPSKTLANARLSNVVNRESPKRLRSTAKKNSSVTALGTPLPPISVTEESPRDKSAVIVSKKMDLLLKTTSSPSKTTPRGRIRRSPHLTPNFTKFSAVLTSSPLYTLHQTAPVLPQVFGSSRESKDKSLELVGGNGFVDASSAAEENGIIQQKNGTYEVRQGNDSVDKVSGKSEVHDGIYELAPISKTPNLRKKSRKHSISNVESDHCTPEAKKRCRVRFATSSQEDQVKTLVATPSASKSLPTTDTPAKQRLGARLSIGSIGPGSSRRRSRSLPKIEKKTPSTRARATRRSNSMSSFSEKTPKLSQRIQISVKRLSRPRQAVNSEEKSVRKVSVLSKIPNFAQIHQKKFEQMESVVDAQKRVAKRHEKLNAVPQTRISRSSSAPTATVPKKLASSKDQNGAFTRFGFKLRKVEAMKMIAEKSLAVARTKNNVVSNRSILKDVRTNKRFELQMKFRRIADDKR